MARNQAPPSEIEAFREDLDSNMQFVLDNCKHLASDPRLWVDRMLEFYEKFDRLSDAQISTILPHFRWLKEME